MLIQGEYESAEIRQAAMTRSGNDAQLIERYLGSLEARVMRVLWASPGLTVRDVASRLPRSRRRAYTTIMTVMNRLHEKGLLSRELVDRAYVYSPKLNESEFLQDLTQKRVHSLIAEFGDVAVTHFVGEIKQLGPEEFEKLRRLVEESP
jgi:predicted transcriptional regulator